MAYEQIGYLQSDSADHVFCLEHRPSGESAPVWSTGLAAALPCEVCGWRLDGLPKRAVSETEIDLEVRRRAEDRYD